MARGSIIPALGPDALRQVREQLSRQPVIASERKYHNVRTAYRSIQGFERTYDSIKEANYAAGLDLELKARRVAWWLPQVTFPLPGGVKYRLDFLVFYNYGGGLRFIDVKGKATQASTNKIRQVFALYGITVELA